MYYPISSQSALLAFSMNVGYTTLTACTQSVSNTVLTYIVSYFQLLMIL
jgi:hypothetical protein